MDTQRTAVFGKVASVWKHWSQFSTDVLGISHLELEFSQRTDKRKMVERSFFTTGIQSRLSGAEGKLQSGGGGGEGLLAILWAGLWSGSVLALRKALLHSCPLGDPSCRAARLIGVISPCQHLGYAAWTQSNKCEWDV